MAEFIVQQASSYCAGIDAAAAATTVVIILGFPSLSRHEYFMEAGVSPHEALPGLK